jgi:hypothetical protein
MPRVWRPEDSVRRTVAQSALTDDEAQTVRAVVTSLENRWNLAAPERREIRSRLILVLVPAEGEAVDTSLIVPVDGWPAAVLPELAASPFPAQVNALLRHLAAATGSKPSNKWLVTIGRLLGDDEVVRVLRLMLERLVTAPPVPRETRYGSGIPTILDE